ncbi:MULTISPECIES: aminoglycoside phosphotransferase family protein [Pseudomonas]|uniref:aminoglycoside phosphotransferase family protein n=1 Tax=Pseudomonas TaxID=286 RepID=UPI0003C0AF5E|nr:MULTISPECIES: phosphotransferase [Pseudomonas]AGZ37415.1 aminoglycoside phosphotransferase [Pseudomonas sp. VLB120]QQZ35893.1 phosphotransferase [Pseudomonas sp. SK2]WEZ88282.1 phosphotransferase [Pseudomonas sp. NyZ480]
MPDHDVRLQQLTVWLAEQLEQLFHINAAEGSLTAASSDASFRRYFRWQGAGQSFVIMDAPPPQENCRPFVAIDHLLASANVHVPVIHAEDLERGFLLLGDLGRQTYLDVIDADNADSLFHDAIDALLAFQRLPMDAPLPSYDDALLRREVELFPQWYVGRELGLAFNETQQATWKRVSQMLIDSALAQPKVLVHRDFMPRNLMQSEPNPGVLDFQDAVYGPVTYDITCLFKDAFLSWPQARVEGWLRDYWEKARAAGIAVQDSFEAFQRASDLMGVQRHLKVIGIFARICHRDGKPRYLADVPRFFAYIEEVIGRRPELAELGELIAELKAGARA